MIKICNTAMLWPVTLGISVVEMKISFALLCLDRNCDDHGMDAGVSVSVSVCAFVCVCESVCVEHVCERVSQNLLC